MSYKNNDSFAVEQETYTLEVYYEYFHEHETRDNPEHEECEITKVELNGNDITDFWWDFVIDYESDSIIEQICEKERDNR